MTKGDIAAAPPIANMAGTTASPLDRLATGSLRPNKKAIPRLALVPSDEGWLRSPEA